MDPQPVRRIEQARLDFLLLRDWKAVAKGISRTVRALSADDTPMIVGYCGRDETMAKMSDVVRFFTSSVGVVPWIEFWIPSRIDT
jgi:hypothetical protein